MKKLLELLLVFAKIGVSAFGGGYVMLPLVRREVSEKRGWMTDEEVADVYALAQCSPGVIAVNVAVYVGNTQAGVLGGAFAAIGVILPSLIIILSLSAVLNALRENQYYQWAMNGIKVAVSAIVVSAVVRLWKKSVKGWLGYAIFFAAFACAFIFDLPTIPIILGGVLVGVVVFALARRRDSK